MRSISWISGGALTAAFAFVGACSGSEPDPVGDGEPVPDASSTSSSSGGSSSSSRSSGSSSGAPDASSDAPAPDAAKSTMTFFVTSTGSGGAGANLGGLANADKKCQDLATAVGGGDHTWVAYLGTQDPTLNPRDRIGPGPWKNQKGTVIAPDNKTLHTVNVKGADILDEKGMPVPAKERGILTGATKSGATNIGNTCVNWTASPNESYAIVAHTTSDTNDDNFANDTWNFTLGVRCDAKSLAAGNSSGRFYCFAKD